MLKKVKDTQGLVQVKDEVSDDLESFFKPKSGAEIIRVYRYFEDNVKSGKSVVLEKPFEEFEDSGDLINTIQERAEKGGKFLIQAMDSGHRILGSKTMWIDKPTKENSRENSRENSKGNSAEYNFLLAMENISNNMVKQIEMGFNKSSVLTEQAQAQAKEYNAQMTALMKERQDFEINLRREEAEHNRRMREQELELRKKELESKEKEHEREIRLLELQHKIEMENERRNAEFERHLLEIEAKLSEREGGNIIEKIIDRVLFTPQGGQLFQKIMGGVQTTQKAVKNLAEMKPQKEPQVTIQQAEKVQVVQKGGQSMPEQDISKFFEANKRTLIGALANRLISPEFLAFEIWRSIRNDQNDLLYDFLVEPDLLGRLKAIDPEFEKYPRKIEETAKILVDVLEGNAFFEEGKLVYEGVNEVIGGTEPENNETSSPSTSNTTAVS